MSRPANIVVQSQVHSENLGKRIELFLYDIDINSIVYVPLNFLKRDIELRKLDFVLFYIFIYLVFLFMNVY